jgi:hypothetical protein
MTKRLLPLALLFSISTLANENISYLCITDQVTGFHHDGEKDNWQETSFLPGERFLITENGADKYKIEKLDEYGSWVAGCRRRTDQSDDSFTCETRTNAVHFNRTELRFTTFRYFGYWNGSNDSLSMSIGTCTAG